MQLDQGYKGFSFSKEGPLDMRMDPASTLTAAEIINHWSEKELGRIFCEYGEEPRWRKAAHAIVEARRKAPLKTTSDLVKVILSVLKGSSKKKLHPATLIFQGLRICVNRELESLQEGLAKAIEFLSAGGRMGVLSFHRLEDRIVKQVFKTASMPEGKRSERPAPRLKLLTKKPLMAALAEVRANPRCRSAKLRFAEKL